MKLPETARRACVASAPPEASHNTGQQELAALGNACFDYFLELRAPAPISAHTVLHLYSAKVYALIMGPSY